MEEWQEQGVGEHWSVAPLGGQVACVLKKGTLIYLEAEKAIFLHIQWFCGGEQQHVTNFLVFDRTW